MRQVIIPGLDLENSNSCQHVYRVSAFSGVALSPSIIYADNAIH
jgi:hypothetical protein